MRKGAPAPGRATLVAMSAPDARQLFFLGYEVRPVGEAAGPGSEIGGAFVRAWLLATSLEAARQRAEQHLIASGWSILTTLKESAVLPEAGSDEDRAYLRQAQAEGEVFVIDAFPADAPDA